MTDITFTLTARTPMIERLVQDCADRRITFDELCREIARMGYRTSSLYEMVRAAEAQK